MAEDLLLLLPAAASSGGRRAGQAPSMGALRQVLALLSAHESPALRHAAFASLMRAGGQAPTLFREEEDFGPAAAAGPRFPPRVVVGLPGMGASCVTSCAP